ncbi:hypothetical protein AHAS_Ahas14G0101800 [Arachis hypogaea]
MAAPNKCFLVIGTPGVKKGILIIRVFESLKTFHLNFKLQGFYTHEVRNSYENVGFEVVTLDSRICLFISTTISIHHPLFFFLGWFLRIFIFHSSRL